MLLAIFDFDYTISDDNTDTSYWPLLDQTFYKSQYEKFQNSNGRGPDNHEFTWHMLCNSFMQSIDYQTLIQTIENIKLVPGIVDLLKKIKEKDSNNKIIIVSDSNTEFIKKILEKNEIGYLIDEVHTNGFDVEKVEITNYEVAFKIWFDLILFYLVKFK